VVIGWFVVCLWVGGCGWVGAGERGGEGGLVGGKETTQCVCVLGILLLLLFLPFGFLLCFFLLSPKIAVVRVYAYICARPFLPPLCLVVLSSSYAGDLSFFLFFTLFSLFFFSRSQISRMSVVVIVVHQKPQKHRKNDQTCIYDVSHPIDPLSLRLPLHVLCAGSREGA
jgi:hypothetical protein